MINYSDNPSTITDIFGFPRLPELILTLYYALSLGGVRHIMPLFGFTSGNHVIHYDGNHFGRVKGTLRAMAE